MITNSYGGIDLKASLEALEKRVAALEVKPVPAPVALSAAPVIPAAPKV